MALIWLPIGLALPTLSGWLLVRVLEGSHPAFFRFERWILGFIGGTTLTMYVTFLAHVVGLVNFTFWGFLSVQIVLTGILGILYWKSWLWAMGYGLGTHVPKFSAVSWWIRILIVLLVIWTLAKILAGTFLLIASPPYHDDVFNNWNMRGKLFYETERLTLTIPLGDELVSSRGVSSYPPTVPMVKTWLATLNGSWHEGLANSVHALWYISALFLAFFILVRLVPSLWALLGTYLLSSIPLYLMHGMSPYADVFLSVHVLAAAGMLVLAVQKKNSSFLRISICFMALLSFTKNEALLVYLPPLLLILVIFLLKNRNLFPLYPLYAIFAVSAITLPWLAFKWTHGLPFGNAKAISGMGIAWQPAVPYAISIMTFFEGNWLLLFLALIIIIILGWRRAFGHALLPLTAFFLIAYIGQLPLYLFMSLGEEAIKQTGYARGLIHLIPVACVLLTALLYDVSRQCRTTLPSSVTNPP